MAIAAKNGFIADFKTGYLQRAIVLHKCAVGGGSDVAHDGLTGYAVGRLVKITAIGNDVYVISQPTAVSATSISDATHIIAQSDDSLRNVPGDAIPTERYTTRGRNILGNTYDPSDYGANQTYTGPLTSYSIFKTVAVYKIVNSDDVKIIEVAPATVSVRR